MAIDDPVITVLVHSSLIVQLKPIREIMMRIRNDTQVFYFIRFNYVKVE